MFEFNPHGCIRPAKSILGWYGAVGLLLLSKLSFAEAFYNYQAYELGQVRKDDRVYYCLGLKEAQEVQRLFSDAYGRTHSAEQIMESFRGYDQKGCFKTKGYTHMVVKTHSKARDKPRLEKNFDGSEVWVTGEMSIIESLLLPSATTIYVLTYALVPDP